MRKWLPVMICVLVFMPALAIGGSYEGSIQGFSCVTQGKVCPVGREDPMVAAEKVFVLFVKAGKYYFIPNVDRAILARHLNKMVKVAGIMSANFNSIQAKELYVMDGGKWVKKWSQDWQDEIYDEITKGVPLGGS
ncbi:MAG: hypothetical protein JRI47_00565 [Deltaproteobacteria bacterium]|nr:hypothetical protein [Deltaproteobacteria bacterium]